MSSYFVHSRFDLRNFRPDFALFSTLNSTKFGNHAANHIYRDDKGRVVAIRCNCGRDSYHSAINKVVEWKTVLSSEDVKELQKGELALAL